MRPITAADVMNPRVLTVRARMTVRELAHFLMENEISGAPVVDEDSKLVGVVSVTDITFALAEEDEDGEDGEEAEEGEDGVEDEGDRTASDFFRDAWGESLRRAEIEDLELEDELEVREIMTPEVHTVPEETPIPEVAELMIRNHVHRLLVTREDKVVGILSTSDLLGLLVRE
ncbi:MAG TPA: CBS domain-containing protein [Thermoanaerobaculia bacterium]|nr:CBS domain-containing protein [Thermoanaerobaculia bacterium]